MMTRLITSAVAGLLILALLELLLPTQARASTFAGDRPDLPDFDYGVQTYNATAIRSSIYWFKAGQFGGFSHSQAIGAAGGRLGSTANNQAAVFWYLYEPDKIGRKADGAKLKQKDYVGFLVYNIGTTNFSTTAIVSGCKAQASLKGDGIAPYPTQMKWSVSCAGPILDSLGLTAGQKAALANVLGADISNTNHLGGKYPWGQ